MNLSATTLWTATSLAGLAILTGCAGQPEQPAPRELVGCHYFVQDDVARELRLPWGVRLTDAPLTGWPAMAQREGTRRALTLTGRDEVEHPFGYWIAIDPDSVEIGYPAGGGLILRLEARPGTLEGTVRPVGDVIVPGADPRDLDPRPVTLQRALCPDA